MLGRSRAGKPLAELVADADRDTLAAALASARDTTAQSRLALPRANGSSELPALLEDLRPLNPKE